MTAEKEYYYEVHFKDPKEEGIQTLKAKRVFDSPLGLSFICLSDFIFDESSLVIKPSEEQLKKRLESVRSLHISIYNVVSIEEKGLNPKPLHFEKDKSKLLLMPSDNSSH